MSYWRPKELLDISNGLVPGHAAVNKFGRNSEIDSGDSEDVWDGGDDWVAPTTARLHDVKSTSGNDTSAGTGARTVEVYGLTGWSTAEVSETVTLNGTTNVATSNSYVIIHRMKVLTAGSGAINAGDITATAQTDATVTAQITAGEGQTLMAIYGIPSGQSLSLLNYYAAMNRTQTSGNIDVVVKITFNPDATNPVYRVAHRIGLNVAGTSFVQPTFLPPTSVAGPAIIKVRGDSASANNLDISAGFNAVLIDA